MRQSSRPHERQSPHHSITKGLCTTEAFDPLTNVYHSQRVWHASRTNVPSSSRPQRRSPRPCAHPLPFRHLQPPARALPWCHPACTKFAADCSLSLSAQLDRIYMFIGDTSYIFMSVSEKESIKKFHLRSLCMLRTEKISKISRACARMRACCFSVCILKI